LSEEKKLHEFDIKIGGPMLYGTNLLELVKALVDAKFAPKRYLGDPIDVSVPWSQNTYGWTSAEALPPSGFKKKFLLFSSRSYNSNVSYEIKEILLRFGLDFDFIEHDETGPAYLEYFRSKGTDSGLLWLRYDQSTLNKFLHIKCRNPKARSARLQTFINKMSVAPPMLNLTRADTDKIKFLSQRLYGNQQQFVDSNKETQK
jgi:hypothetical protein